MVGAGSTPIFRSCPHLCRISEHLKELEPLRSLLFRDAPVRVAQFEIANLQFEIPSRRYGALPFAWTLRNFPPFRPDKVISICRSSGLSSPVT